MPDEIESLRREIDALDDQLAALLNRRAGLAQRIGALKSGAPAYRPEREIEILRRITKNPGVLPAERVAAVFREVISACRGLEEAIRVSYLGPEGTFSEQAVRKHFGRAVEGQPSGSVDEAFRRCESGAVQFAVVPVENSTEGVVGRTLDLLLATPLRICAEIELRVQQNLLCKGESLRAVRRVYSHAQSLAQCNGWLAQNLPGAERVAVASNAEAAQRASTEEGSAAIAGEAAAERYRLNVLARSIEDAPNNTTRFLVLGNLDPAPTGNDRTSLVMSAENRPGAVHALLTPLAQNRVSMSRIESRPSRAGGRAVGVHVLHRHRGPPKGPGRCRSARRTALQGAVPENTRLLPLGMLIDPCELSPSYVRSIAPYQPGKPISELAREMGLDEAGIVKLASNENPRGIGPRTRAAIEAAIGGVARYPDGNGFELKQALSARYGVDPSSIVLGNGSNDVLELVALAFLGPGRAAVLSEHAFAVYPLATQARGARAIVVPAKNYGHDLETMAKAIDDETYVAWIANPNNPTGTLARADEVQAFLRRVPERVIVVLDEAYNEYLTPEPGCASASRSRIRRSPT